jgi:hypothetical protein
VEAADRIPAAALRTRAEEGLISVVAAPRISAARHISAAALRILAALRTLALRLRISVRRISAVDIPEVGRRIS